MKRLIATAGFCAIVGLGAVALAGPAKGHPNLQAALKALNNAESKIWAAQRANEFDLDGHAAKAKALISQAKGELEQAARAANKNHQ